MLVFFLILFLLFIVFLIMLILRIELEIKIIIKNGQNFSFIIIRFLRGLLRLRVNLSIRPDGKGLLSIILRKTDSSLESATSVEQVLKSVQKGLHVFRKYKNQMAYLKSKVSFQNFSVRSRVGVGDAAATALTIGGVYTIFAVITHYLEAFYSLKKRKILILPYFQGTLLDIDLDCIINFKLGHIIFTGMKIIVQKFKGGENGGRTSY